MPPKLTSRGSWLVRYGTAVAAVGAGMLLRQGLTAWVGPGLPTYITFYPAIMAVALLAGFGPGLLATAATLVVVDYWVITPHDFGSNNPAEAVGMGLFSLMGVFISITSELYRRARVKAAAFDRDQALRETRRQNEFLASVLERAAQPFAVSYPDRRLGLRDAPHLPAALVPKHLAGLETVIPGAEVGGLQGQTPLFGGAAQVGAGLLGLLARLDRVFHQVEGRPTRVF